MQEEKSQALVLVPSNPIDELSPEAKLFYDFHGAQLIGSEFPPELISSLHLKLTDEAYDGGEFFEIVDNEDNETFQVRAKAHVAAKGNLFLIDHALTFRYPELRQSLKANPKIRERLEYMLKYQVEKKPTEQQTEESASPDEELEFDDMDLLDVSMLQFPKTLTTLSLVDNKLENPDELISKLQYLNLKVLWLNGNSVAQHEKMTEYVNTKTRIELFNSEFTRHCSEWGLKYAHYRKVSACNLENGKISCLNLDDRNIFNIDASLFESFTNLRSISLKSHNPSTEKEFKMILQILQLKSLRYIYVDEELERKIREAVEKGEIDVKDIEGVLINKHSFKQELEAGDEQLDSICSRIFRVAGCYRLASSIQLDETACWYVNDELGSCIAHNDKPTVKLIPFLYAPNNKLDDQTVSFTLLWPLKDINEGDFISKDYLNGIPYDKQREARLAAWFKQPEAKLESLISDYDRDMLKLSGDSVNVLQKFYNQNALKQMEKASTMKLDEQILKVFSEYEFINTFLKHERFEIVDQPDKANILWITGAIDEDKWAQLQKNHVLNQFPFESCVVMKHHLANTIQSVFGDCKFLMRTYDLDKELSIFLGDYHQREKEGQDNLWILKPPNMARSMDMIITDNLSLIIRNMETGPKLVQKYISNPVLRRGRKVDLRYILLVKSISPLRLFLYKNFWIRSANNEYTVDRRHLSSYETQFTVMNYGKVSNFEQIKYQDFIEEFESDYKTSWKGINQKIKKMLRNTFIAVGGKYPQMHSDSSRAVYGIDIMVDAESMEPQLLEITFSPDCKRACEYYPAFYDNVFQTLFLDTMSENMERII